jgi:hypothetical protein
MEVIYIPSPYGLANDLLFLSFSIESGVLGICIMYSTSGFNIKTMFWREYSLSRLSSRGSTSAGVISSLFY